MHGQSRQIKQEDAMMNEHRKNTILRWVCIGAAGVLLGLVAVAARAEEGSPCGRCPRCCPTQVQQTDPYPNMPPVLLEALEDQGACVVPVLRAPVGTMTDEYGRKYNLMVIPPEHVKCFNEEDGKNEVEL